MSYFSSFRVLAFLFWCSLLLLLLGFIVFWTLTYQAKRFLWQTLLLLIILNFADKFFLKNSRPQNRIYTVFLYLWAEMLSHILSWKRRTQMITFPVYGERSRPGFTGPLNSYGPGWVSRVPSVPELWQRSRNNGEGLIWGHWARVSQQTTAFTKVQGSWFCGHYCLSGESTWLCKIISLQPLPFRNEFSEFKKDPTCWAT